jgi:hypothetical protein
LHPRNPGAQKRTLLSCDFPAGASGARLVNRETGRGLSRVQDVDSESERTDRGRKCVRG